jgi:hypothetical protein
VGRGGRERDLLLVRRLADRPHRLARDQRQVDVDAGKVLRSFRNSTTDPGHPWVIRSGSAPGSGERACRKWISSPSISVRNCPIAFNRASTRRQS